MFQVSPLLYAIYYITMLMYMLVWYIYAIIDITQHGTMLEFIYAPNWLAVAIIAYFAAALTSSLITYHAKSRSPGAQADGDIIELREVIREDLHSVDPDTTMTMLVQHDQDPNAEILTAESVRHTSLEHLQREKSSNPAFIPCHRVIATLLFSTVAAPNIIHSILYYCQQFPWRKIHQPEYKVDVLSLHQNTISSLILLTDLFISRLPVRKLQFIYADIYILLYGIITILNWIAGAENFNGGITERTPPHVSSIGGGEPWRAVGVGSAVVCLGVPILHSLLCLMRQGQDKLSERMSRGHPPRSDTNHPAQV